MHNFQSRFQDFHNLHGFHIYVCVCVRVCVCVNKLNWIQLNYNLKNQLIILQLS